MMNLQEGRLKVLSMSIFDIIVANRGLYDYNVVCDGRNNPGEVIDRNELVVDIFIKPTIAAEIIRLVVNVVKTSAQFEELIVSSMQ